MQKDSNRFLGQQNGAKLCGGTNVCIEDSSPFYWSNPTCQIFRFLKKTMVANVPVLSSTVPVQSRSAPIPSSNTTTLGLVTFPCQLAGRASPILSSLCILHLLAKAYRYCTCLHGLSVNCILYYPYQYRHCQ